MKEGAIKKGTRIYHRGDMAKMSMEFSEKLDQSENHNDKWDWVNKNTAIVTRGKATYIFEYIKDLTGHRQPQAWKVIKRAKQAREVE